MIDWMLESVLVPIVGLCMLLLPLGIVVVLVRLVVG